jgi:hypothetical protein
MKLSSKRSGVTGLAVYGLTALVVGVHTLPARADDAPVIQRLPTVHVQGESEPPSCEGDLTADARYACLNAELAALAARQRHQQTVLDSVATASLPQSPTAQGLFSQTAMRIRMGNTFGRSVYPQRVPLHHSLNR